MIKLVWVVDARPYGYDVRNTRTQEVRLQTGNRAHAQRACDILNLQQKPTPRQPRPAPEPMQRPPAHWYRHTGDED